MKHKKILSEIVDEVGISQTKEWLEEARSFYKHSNREPEDKKKAEFEYILHKFNNYVLVKYTAGKAGDVC